MKNTRIEKVIGFIIAMLILYFLGTAILSMDEYPKKEDNINQEVSQEIYYYWMPLRQDKIVRELFYFMFDDDGKLTYDEHERLKIYLEINSTEIQMRNEEVLNGTR